MTPTIRVDDEVYEGLKEKAEPFTDTPNSVIRRLLELPASGNGASPESEQTFDEGTEQTASTEPRRRRRPRSKAKRGRRQRAVRGTLVPQAEYEMPILQVLVDNGGRAPSREVIDGIESLLADKLKGIDRSETSSGEIRWRNRAQFVRLTLIEKGQLVKDSPRGVWEIAEAGRERVKKGQ